jgi:peroxiredoxin
VDADKKVAIAYGATNAVGGIQRSVFVIDKEGKVAWSKQGMPATEEILAAITP